MAAVTKGSGKYFYENDRVWAEAQLSGVSPSWVGNWPWRFSLDGPVRKELQKMFEGPPYVKHVQANRVGCFDLTVSFSKSVSLLAYGLTPPSEWKGWTETFARISAPEVTRLLGDQRVNSGAQGAEKLKSEGVAVPFHHFRGFLGQVHAHTHYAIPNVTISTDPKVPGKDPVVGSIANARELFQQQGVVRARVQKGLDDELQSRGIETVRVGKKVELAGVPKELIEELSPARRAMNEAKAQKEAEKAGGQKEPEKSKEDNGPAKPKGERTFDGPKAQDFFARQARRGAGPRVEKTPDELHRDCKEAAARHGVTLESLTKASRPDKARDPATEMTTALHVAKEARDACVKKHGTFSAEQFQEKLFTLGIGKPVTLETLDVMGKAALKDPGVADIRAKQMTDGTTRYAAPESAKVEREAERPYRPDTKEAWEDLKAATKGLGAAVLIATAKKATEVAQRLAEVVNPPAQKLTIKAEDLPALIDKLTPTHYVKAHAKALLSGLLNASGNPHERAGHAQAVYAELREHYRLPKNTVVIVKGGDGASAKDLLQLGKIARRDGAVLIVTERGADHQKSHERDHTRFH